MEVEVPEVPVDENYVGTVSVTISHRELIMVFGTVLAANVVTLVAVNKIHKVLKRNRRKNR